MKTMKRSAALVAAAVVTAAFTHAANAADKHLVYMQGCCVKTKGSAVAKGYQEIAQKLRDAGFNVFFELRTADETDGDEQVQAYAAKVAGHVKELIAKGTAPEDITVSGYSLGSMTAMVVAGIVANPKVNYVLLAGCPTNANIRINIDYAKVRGRVLSVIDSTDDRFGSCAGRLPAAEKFEEVLLDSGDGHKVFRLIDETKLKLWKEPLEKWAKGQ